jgi:general stress protein CsbA
MGICIVRKGRKRSSRRPRFRYYVALILIPLAVLVFIAANIVSDYFSRAYMLSMLSSRPDCSSLPRRALIADSLYSDYPNNAMIERISAILRSAGYVVDVRRGSEVSPDLYSMLNEYSVAILRIHGGKADIVVDGRDIKINGLFTGLEWRDEYIGFKENGTGTRAFPYNSTRAYLAVLPSFFEKRISGLFCKGSVVIVASCYSLYTRDIADTLATKGLSYYIGYEGLVSVGYIDRSLEKLIEYVFKNNMNWVNASKKVLEDLGPDPTMGEYIQVIHYREQ